MKRILAVAVAMLGLLVSAGVAAAATPPGDPAAQAAGQAATSGQAAGALSGASQSQPANQNISVRVLSPGGNGDVTQSNTVSSNATAANANLTDQSAGSDAGRLVRLCGRRNAGDRPGVEVGPGRVGALARDPAGREQHEHPGARSEPRGRR